MQPVAAEQVFPDPDRVFHYVPGEFFVMVSTSPHSPVDPYADIQRMLHDTIKPLLPLADAPDMDDSRPDNLMDRRILGPTIGTWKGCRIAPDDGDTGEVLFRPPLRGTDIRSAHFPQVNGTTIGLYFFRVALAPVRSLATLRLHTQVVPEIVSLIHREFIHTTNEHARELGLTYHAVSPNWLSFLAGCGGNSPGTPALPVAKTSKMNVGGSVYAQFGFWNDATKFGSEALETIVTNERTARTLQPLSGVQVAVLDTCPSPGRVKTAVRRFGSHNGLLQAITNRDNPVIIEDHPSLDATDDFKHIIPFLPNYLGGLVDWYKAVEAGSDEGLPEARKNYGAADHGLFVAGIIKDIAPGAKVRLIRVLDDAGVGDLLGIAWVLSLLAMEAAPNRLIINLSLTFDIPTLEELEKHWLETTGYVGDIPQGVQDRLRNLLAGALGSIATLFDHLRTKNILVVAAAGNDTRDPAQRLDARLPAYHSTVLSVSSVTRDAPPNGGYSLFSNKSDPRHGLATLSGDGALKETPKRMLMENDGIVDGVQGVFSGSDMTSNETGEPSKRDKNLSGWVFWAGTSFSTPIISALAADIQANELKAGNDPLAPEGLIEAVQSFKDDRQKTEDIDCPVIYAYQEQV